MPWTNSTPSLPFQSQSDTSRDAAIRNVGVSGQQTATILGWFAIRGEQGGTQKEIREQCGYERHTITWRVKELENANLIVKSTDRRNGCRVYRSWAYSHLSEAVGL